jgi:integrase/recombinase XerC
MVYARKVDNVETVKDLKEKETTESIVTTTIIQKEKKHSGAEFPIYIEEFAEFLRQLRYSETTIESHKIKGRKLCKQLEEFGEVKFNSISDFEQITIDLIGKYEQYLKDMIKKGKYEPSSVHAFMKTVRLFLKFLLIKKVISIKYVIPKPFVASVNRANYYIETKTIIQLAESILTNKDEFVSSRNLALLLLFVETGCRPIEACSLLISDISFTEKTISLNSVKSGRRKIKLDDYVLNIFKKYNKLRNHRNPKCDHFFLKNDGSEPNRKYLTNLLFVENKKAFGKNLVHARALRHTYVTNAIDNNNDFSEVSVTMGHKHWVSTMYYLHRDKNRLLKNTLPYNPINIQMINGDDLFAN